MELELGELKDDADADMDMEMDVDGLRCWWPWWKAKGGGERERVELPAREAAESGESGSGGRSGEKARERVFGNGGDEAMISGIAKSTDRA